MFDRFFQFHPEYTLVAKPSGEQINAYRGLLSEEILYFWENYGFGSFMNGYLKIVDPKSFQSFVDRTYQASFHPMTVFAVTALGDILVWEKDLILQVNYRMGTSQAQVANAADFFNIFLGKWSSVEGSMNAKNFLEGVKRLGEPSYDEGFGYTPALALGGAEKAEKLEKVKLREHLEILSQLVGVIE